jgi:hypothetical protein
MESEVLGPILNHFNLAQTSHPVFFQMYFNIVFQFLSNSPK